MAKKTGWGPPSTLPTTYDAYIASLSPTLWWKAAEASGTVAADSSGNGHNGTYSSSGVTYGVTGPIPGDTAVSFDGATGCITSVYAPASGSAMSAIAWWKGLPTIWAPALFVTADSFSSGNGFMLLVGTLSGSSQLDFFVASPNLSDHPPNDSAWHMIGASKKTGGTFDGTNDMILCIDGVQVAGLYTGATFPVSGNHIQAGAPYGADSFYPGDCGQFAFWDGVGITPAQYAHAFSLA